MDTKKRDTFIARKLNEGYSLSEVQRLLAEEHGVNLTYFDLRLIASDLKVKWKKQDKEKEAKRKAEEKKIVDADAAASEEGTPGKTEVTVHKVSRPDAAMSGTVKCASGARAEWFLDHFGRLGLQPEQGSEKPTEEDVREFQQELQRQLSG